MEFSIPEEVKQELHNSSVTKLYQMQIQLDSTWMFIFLVIFLMQMDWWTTNICMCKNLGSFQTKHHQVLKQKLIGEQSYKQPSSTETRGINRMMILKGTLSDSNKSSIDEKNVLGREALQLYQFI